MNFLTRSITVLLCFMTVKAQAGENDRSGGIPSPAKPAQTINTTTSYAQRKRDALYINLPFSPTITFNQTPGYLAWAYGDFDHDGDIDILAVNVNWTPTGDPVEFFENKSGNFVKNLTVFGDAIPTTVHGRKAIAGDFDGNGFLDVVIAGHGYDKRPFKGEEAFLFANTNGKFTAHKLPIPAGFYHSVCAGDVNNDGHLDLFFTDFLGSKSKLLINDGRGGFTYQPSYFPQELQKGGYYTSEFYDLNKDGFRDLVVAGHEYDGSDTTILWGDGTGKFTADRSTRLPAVHGYGIILDIGFIESADGKSTDIVVNRTGSPDGPIGWYHGYHLQLLKQDKNGTYIDSSPAFMRDNSADRGKWITWILIRDVNQDGVPDIVSLSKADNLLWINQDGVYRKLNPSAPTSTTTP